jgi:hypothetical protein
MNTQDRNNALDRNVDYIRQVVVVIFGTIGAYWSIINEKELFFPWAILLLTISAIQESDAGY